MQLITIVTIAIAALTVLSGLSTFFGSRKQNRASAVWLLVFTLGLTIWSASIAKFLSLGTEEYDFARILIVGVICGITVADVGLIGYSGWKYKPGKIALILLTLAGVFVVGALVVNPGVFYSSISLNDTCNKMEIVKGWYYYLLMAYYAINTFTFLGFLLYTIVKATNKKLKVGLKVFYVGLSISGIFALVFDLILLSSVPQFIWVGPVATAIALLCYYYSVVRYSLLSLSANWMKIFSYIILAIGAAIVYILIFYLVFMALFRIPSPSPAILLLNLIMAAIGLCLMPAIYETFTMLSSLVAMKQIDIGYITKKLSKLTKKTADPKEIAGFLADHLHLEYVGLLINGRLYGSGSLNISSDDLVEIEHLGAAKQGIWQETNNVVSKIFIDLDLKNVAELHNNKNEVFGQVLLGRPVNKKVLTRQEIIQVEMVINLVASIIDAERHSRK